MAQAIPLFVCVASLLSVSSNLQQVYEASVCTETGELVPA